MQAENFSIHDKYSQLKFINKLSPPFIIFQTSIIKDPFLTLVSLSYGTMTWKLKMKYVCLCAIRIG